jgi:Cu-processing system ATP-binding protein
MAHTATYGGGPPVSLASDDSAIAAVGLRKRFGPLEVLRGIDLWIPAGRITGLVGPNAAGKTTLLKAILGLVRVDEGILRVLGRMVNGDTSYRRSIGYVPQAARFPENLTGHEVVRMLQHLRELPEEDTDIELLQQFGLGSELGKPLRVLSGGTRQKLSAALAFLFRPSLLILDEPTAGLDPVASGVFKDRIRRAREEGATVILASHTLSELEELADDIVFLLEGGIRYAGPIRPLVQMTGLANLERAVASLMNRGSP